MIPYHDAILRIFLTLLETRPTTPGRVAFDDACDYADKLFKQWPQGDLMPGTVCPIGPGQLVGPISGTSDTGPLSNKGARIL